MNLCRMIYCGERPAVLFAGSRLPRSRGYSLFLVCDLHNSSYLMSFCCMLHNKPQLLPSADRLTF